MAEQTAERAAVRIMVGTPCTQGGITRQYLDSILALQQRCHERGWQLQVETRSDGLVTRTRNIFASHVVRSDDFTHLLMADADIGFPPELIERLVDSGHDVVGAVVPFREVKWQRVRNALDAVPYLTEWQLQMTSHEHAVSFLRTSPQKPTDGFLRVQYLGGALLIATRAALARMAASDQVTYYTYAAPWHDWDTDGWNFFDPLVDPELGTYLSEDYAFCLRWRNLGGEVWADVTSTVTHTGDVTIASDVTVSLATAREVIAARKAQSST